jgi:hypothetical protein
MIFSGLERIVQVSAPFRSPERSLLPSVILRVCEFCVPNELNQLRHPERSLTESKDPFFTSPVILRERRPASSEAGR